MMVFIDRFIKCVGPSGLLFVVLLLAFDVVYILILSFRGKLK